MLSSQQLYRARAVRVSVHSFQPCTFASDRTAAAPDIRAHSLPAVQLQLHSSEHICFRLRSRGLEHQGTFDPLAEKTAAVLVYSQNAAFGVIGICRTAA